MQYPLFSEISHNNNPVLDAYDNTHLKGDITKDPLVAAITAHVNNNGGDPNSTEVQIAVRDRLIGAFITQITNLWIYFENASKESEQYNKYLQEKMNEVADLKTKAIKDGIIGKQRLHGPPGGGGNDSGGDNG